MRPKNWPYDNDDIILSYQDVTLRIAAQTDGPPLLKVMLENRVSHCVAQFPLRDVRPAFECFVGLSSRHGNDFEKKVESFLVLWSSFLERTMEDFNRFQKHREHHQKTDTQSKILHSDELVNELKKEIANHNTFLHIRTEYVRIIREIELAKKDGYETRPPDDQSKWMRKIMEKFVEDKNRKDRLQGGLDG